MLKLWEEKEKVKTISPFSRREREMLNPVPLFWEEKEKSRVHNFREEKEKFSFSDIKYPPKTSLHNSFPPNLKPWKCIFLSKNMKHFSQEEKEKQRTESHESRVERDFCLHNLENREEKENWFKDLGNREKKEIFCLKILKIEKRNENTQKYQDLHSILVRESFMQKIKLETNQLWLDRFDKGNDQQNEFAGQVFLFPLSGAGVVLLF